MRGKRARPVVRNEGDAFPAAARFAWSVRMPVAGTSDPAEVMFKPVRLNLRPGASRAVTLSFLVPQAAPTGAVELVALLAQPEGPADDEPEDARVAVVVV